MEVYDDNTCAGQNTKIFEVVPAFRKKSRRGHGLVLVTHGGCRQFVGRWDLLSLKKSTTCGNVPAWARAWHRSPWAPCPAPRLSAGPGSSPAVRSPVHRPSPVEISPTWLGKIKYSAAFRKQLEARAERLRLSDYVRDFGVVARQGDLVVFVHGVAEFVEYSKSVFLTLPRFPNTCPLYCLSLYSLAWRPSASNWACLKTPFAVRLSLADLELAGRLRDPRAVLRRS